MIGSDRFISTFGVLTADMYEAEGVDVLGKAIRLATANGFDVVLTDSMEIPLCTEKVKRKRETCQCGNLGGWRTHLYPGTPGKPTPTLASARSAINTASQTLPEGERPCLSVDLATSGYVVVETYRRTVESTVVRGWAYETWFELPEGVEVPRTRRLVRNLPDRSWVSVALSGLLPMPPTMGTCAPHVVGQPARISGELLRFLLEE